MEMVTDTPKGATMTNRLDTTRTERDANQSLLTWSWNNRDRRPVRSAEFIRQLAIDIAEDELATKYPQYRGHWDGDEWQLHRIRRDVRSKLGQAFEAGDIVLAKYIPSLFGAGEYTAYSIRNAVNTRLGLSDLEAVAG